MYVDAQARVEEGRGWDELGWDCSEVARNKPKLNAQN